VTANQRDTLIVQYSHNPDPTIDGLLWMMQDSRQMTLDTIAGLDQATLDWEPEIGGNSVGSLLYHIAGVEMDWLYTEVLEQEPPAEIIALFPSDMRDDDGHLARWRGEDLSALEHRLSEVRRRLLATYASMNPADFRRARSLDDYDVTPEWVLHHLLQDEAVHRGEIGMVRLMASQARIAS
jgi:uncharacterized damage-inducible protein DinB